MTDEMYVRRVLDMRETLYRISYGLLASEQDRRDAVQECLLKAWEKRKTLRDVAFIKTWVTRILINECYAIGRKRHRMILMDRIPEQEDMRFAPPDADLLVHDSLLSLPEKLRLPIMLYYMEGYGIKEIAGMLRIPQGTVSTRLRSGKEKLREILGDDEEVFCHA
jgi:RNA polymerase sigma-70 factor (ECF subfamily)